MLGMLADAVGGDLEAAKRWLTSEVMPAAIKALGDAPVPDALEFWKAAVKQAVAKRSGGGSKGGGGHGDMMDAEETAAYLANLEALKRKAVS